jgi:hypothetical protein|tara:strand:+ start:395 stop:661 length:267 start_codon:yes stop_codon:yes gene_type:complete
MIDITEIEVGKSYACKFKVEHILDEFGRIPGLSDVPLQGLGWYEGTGILQVRDSVGKRVQLKDEKSGKEFVVPFSQIWDIDVAEYVEE